MAVLAEAEVHDVEAAELADAELVRVGALVAEHRVVGVDRADALEASCVDLTGASINALSTSADDARPSTESITSADCAQVASMIQAVELRTEPVQCDFEALLPDDALLVAVATTALGMATTGVHIQSSAAPAGSYQDVLEATHCPGSNFVSSRISHASLTYATYTIGVRPSTLRSNHPAGNG